MASWTAHGSRSSLAAARPSSCSWPACSSSRSAACSGGGERPRRAKTTGARGQHPGARRGRRARRGHRQRPGTLADADRDAIVDTVPQVRHRRDDRPAARQAGRRPRSALHAAGAAPRSTGLDRAAASTRACPRPTGTVKAQPRRRVPLTALSDPSGAIDLVGTLALPRRARRQADRGPVRVQRTGELVLARDAGTWKIASFKLAADRTGAGLRGRTTTSTHRRTARTMITALRRHPFVTAAVLVPLVIVLALAGGFVALAQRRPAAVRVRRDRGSRSRRPPRRLHGRARTSRCSSSRSATTAGPARRPTRGDAIHLIGVNPALRKATILDFPRDTGLPIPGHGTDKVNVAHVYGGAALQAETLGNAVGVQVPYAIDTNFAGFIAMVDDMGGLEVNVPEAMDDDGLGRELPAPARSKHERPPGARVRPQPAPVPHRRPQPLREPGLPDRRGARAAPGREHRARSAR